MVLADHVEIEILEFIHIRPVTMPEHVMFAVLAFAFVGFACYGVARGARDAYRWWSNRRSGGSLVEQTTGAR